MKQILTIILLVICWTSRGQNIISNNFNVRLNGFKVAYTVGAGTPSSTDSVSAWYNDKTWKHFGKAYLFKDSLPLITSIGAGMLDVVDTTNGQLKRILPSSLISSILPTQSGNTGKYLFTDGTNASWQAVVNPLVYTDTSATTVANTTSTLTLLGTGLGSSSISDITAGSVITFKGAGTISTDATAGIPQIIFNLANVGVAQNLVGLANALTDSPFSYECTLIVPTIGNAKRLLYAFTISVDNNGVPITYQFNGVLTGLAISSTATYDLTATWNTAATSNSLTSIFNTIEIKRK